MSAATKVEPLVKRPSHALSLPNMITYYRFVAALLVWWAPFSEETWDYAYLALVVGSAIFSDFLDGYLARLLNQESNIGEQLDPLADKAFVTSSLILFYRMDIIGDLLLCGVIAIVVRDVVVSILRKMVTLSVTKIAKHKTAIQMTAMVVLLIGNLVDRHLSGWLGIEVAMVTSAGFAILWLAILLTVYTGWKYLWKAVRQAT